MERMDIANPFAGAASFLVESTGSTQEEAKRLASEGWPPGSLVAAEEQTAGRGRFADRSWTAEVGKNLLVTVCLGAPRAALPLRVGLALCEAVEDYASEVGAAFPSPPRIKWPNDLMIGDRKAAGILCESALVPGANGGAPAAFAGVGLNCNQLSFPGVPPGKATSLAVELGREVDRWGILEGLLGRLAAGLGPDLARPADPVPPAAWRAAVRGRLWRLGASVSFLPGLASRSEAPEAVAGTLAGIGIDGSLLLEVDGEAEARAFHAGELTAVPHKDKVES